MVCTARTYVSSKPGIDYKKSLDDAVKQMQMYVFTKKCSFYKPSENDREYMFGCIMSIDAINRNFKTDYLATELFYMKITDSNGQVCEFFEKLPFHKGDENIFENK